MSEEVQPVPRMVTIAAQYMPKVTLLSAGAGGLQKILQADSRRFYVAFYVSGGLGTMPLIVPGPVPNNLPVASLNSAFIESKWKDRPAATTGEWYANLPGATSLVIVEELYLGDA